MKEIPSEFLPSTHHCPLTTAHSPLTTTFRIIVSPFSFFTLSLDIYQGLLYGKTLSSHLYFVLCSVFKVQAGPPFREPSEELSVLRAKVQGA